MRSKYLLVFPLGLLLFFIAGSWSWRRALSPVGTNKPPVILRIVPGESISSLGRRLKENGLIRDPLVFVLYLRLKGLDAQIQAGEFKVSPLMSVPELVNQLTQGVEDLSVTIPEGFRVEEVGERVVERFLADSEKLVGQFHQDELERWQGWKEEFTTLAGPEEGFLFPDTYLLSRSTMPAELVTVMKENFNRKVTDQLREDARRRGLDLKELITLASIVEREVKFAEDRPIVAGILLRRYRQGTLLGADATVQYDLGYSEREKTWWRKEMTVRDLERDSPYNTRKHPGLPPTPIANPGLAAIKAVVYPETTDYFYYLSDREGKMHYGVTFEDHQANMAKYLD